MIFSDDNELKKIGIDYNSRVNCKRKKLFSGPKTKLKYVFKQLRK